MIDAKIEKKIEELYEKLYEKHIDMKVEKNTYEVKHSKLMDLLNSEFQYFEHKFEGLLREPNFYNKMELYDLTPRASTSPTSTSAASTRSNCGSTCSTKDLNKRKPLF